MESLIEEDSTPSKSGASKRKLKKDRRLKRQEAEMESAPGGDACAICLLEVDEGDAERCPAGGQCSLIAHTECLAEALRRDPRCPQCRD